MNDQRSIVVSQRLDYPVHRINDISGSDRVDRILQGFPWRAERSGIVVSTAGTHKVDFAGADRKRNAVGGLPVHRHHDVAGYRRAAQLECDFGIGPYGVSLRLPAPDGDRGGFARGAEVVSVY